MADKKLSVLLVEDDPNDVLLIKRALLRCAIDNPVHVAPDGEKAVAYLKSLEAVETDHSSVLPDIILTDLKMPRMNGLEFLRWLKNHPSFRMVPVVVLTSSAERDDIHEAYILGASSYIVKPASFDELQKTIRTLMEYWQVCQLDAPRHNIKHHQAEMKQ